MRIQKFAENKFCGDQANFGHCCDAFIGLQRREGEVIRHYYICVGDRERKVSKRCTLADRTYEPFRNRKLFGSRGVFF